jgi:hypothetical protein
MRIVGGVLLGMAVSLPAFGCAKLLGAPEVTYGADAGDGQADVLTNADGACRPPCLDLDGGCAQKEDFAQGGSELRLRDDYLYWAAQTVIQRRQTTDAAASIDPYAEANRPDYFALDGDEVFLTSGAASDLESCTAPCVNAGRVLTQVSGVNGLALDATHVYWTDPGGPHRMPRDGGTREQYTDVPGGSFAIALDDTNVFIRSDCGIFNAKKDGATKTAVALDVPPSFCGGGSQPRNLLVSGAYVFGASYGVIVRVALPQLTPTSVSGLQGVTALAAYCGVLYFAYAGDPDAGVASKGVAALPFDRFGDPSATATTVATGFTGDYLAVDATGVYVSDGSKVLRYR